MNLLKLLLTLFIPIIFIGCSISDETKISAENLDKSINNSKAIIKSNQQKFLNDPLTTQMNTYVVKENLNKNFENSLKTISFVGNEYKSKITPILNNNSHSEEELLLNNIGHLNSLIRKAVSDSQQPSIRLIYLKSIFEKKDVIYSDSIKIISNINKKLDLFNQLTIKVKNEYPAKTVDLENRISILKNIHKISKDNFNIIELELLKKDSMDLSLFSNTYDNLKKNNEEITSKSEENTKKINELFHSYLKILSDMKINYFVKVGRSSWDESSDWDSETAYYYPLIEVSQKTFEYFDSVSDQDMGSLGGGMFSSTSKNDINTNWNKTAINSLNINARENLPSGDDSADFWLEELLTTNYHKYTIIEDGKVTETDWIKVNDETFDKNVDNLGMEIISKPLGFYEEEKIVTAAPAGMSYVGNNHYGEWKTNSSGNSFWHYYGMYSFMNNLGGVSSTYSRTDYTSYDNSRRKNENYYGSGSSTYGTYGRNTYNSGSRYSRSDFARKNSTTIRNSSHSSSSIRNAGHSSRGRGPGGGGK